MAEDRDKSDSESPKDFTISDRRHWARKEAGEPAPAKPEPASPPPEAKVPPEAEVPPTAEVPPEELPPADFSYLVVFLATQALLCLGEQPDPQTGLPLEKNLPGARHAIDLLTVIQDKTAGNLSDDEHQLLENILYDLRLRYVAATGPDAS